MENLPEKNKPEENSSEDEEFSDAKEACEENEIPDFIDEELDLDEEILKERFKEKSKDELQDLKDEAASLKQEGNELFKRLDYSEALKLYTRALNTCPLEFHLDRSVLYANRAAARINLDKKEDAILDCNKAIELNPNYLKAILRRAQLHQKMENLDQCLVDYQKVLELDENNREARQACLTLPGEIAEKNEKLKTEMLGKLKDLGNLVLRPFGLSTENFKVVQDPNSGGYSVNFQNNADKSAES